MSDYRYSVKNSDVFTLESEFSKVTKSPYTVAVNSCSSAMFIALKAGDIKAGDVVFVPAYTFVAVPSAIVHAGGVPVLVEVTKDLSICLEDFEKKINKYPKAKILLLSYMRCHIPNMDDLFGILEKYNIKLIEDAAHALGAYWGSKMLGTLGVAGCYSTQSFKIIKSGEGGILVTNNESIAARSIYFSGAYENLWKLHGARPSDELLKSLQGELPCFGLRMTNPIAKTILSQLADLDSKRNAYKERYKLLRKRLGHFTFISFPSVHEKATPILDIFSFYLESFGYDDLNIIFYKIKDFDRSISWYGNLSRSNARSFWEWGFIESKNNCDNTKKILSKLFEIKIDLSESEEDFEKKIFSLEKIFNEFNA